MALFAEISPIYKFGESMIDETKIIIDNKHMTVPGFSQAINLSISSPYGDNIE